MKLTDVLIEDSVLILQRYDMLSPNFNEDVIECVFLLDTHDNWIYHGDNSVAYSQPFWF